MSTIEPIAIAKHYRPITAANAVDLHADEGELVTIPGPGGSGKTTRLMRRMGLFGQP